MSSLRAAIEGFTDVDACVASLRERTPTEVAEGLADLGYDGLFDDVCRATEAVRDGSEEACDALSVSSAQRGCRRRLALFHGRPAACPEDRVLPGRDPVCVAWAARNPDLCRAAATAERVRCRAVLRDDARVCRHARGVERARCEGEVARYGGALEGPRRRSAAARARPVMTLTVGGERIAREALGRGVRLVTDGCRRRARLADPLGEPVGVDARTWTLELAFGPRVELPSTRSLSAAEARLTVNTPDASLDSVSGARGEVRIEAFEPQLGGAIEGTIEGSLDRRSGRVPVRGRFSSFVRDLDPLPEACAAR